MNNVTLKSACQSIIHRCDTLDFPLFSSKEKKLMILQRERESIDKAFDILLEQNGLQHFLSAQQRHQLWMQASEDARREFSNLDNKHLLNGFYLQEVTHRYAELQAAALFQPEYPHP